MFSESYISINLFSNRELASSFWLAIGLAYLLYSETFRPYITALVKSFCNPYILTPILGLGLYIAVLSLILIEVGLWNYGQYKNVTLWFISVGIYSLFQITNVNKGLKSFKQRLVDLFKITTIFEFIVTFYSFNFWFELIFMPIITILILMAEFSKNSEEHRTVYELLKRIVEIIGYCVLFYVAYLLLSKPDEFFNEGTFYDFLVPILLTVGIFPYLYVVLIYVEYERFFRRLKFRFKTRGLERYAKYKAMLCFNVQLSTLKRWDRYITIHDIDSKDDIDTSVRKIKALIKRDKKNTPVSFEEGWSRYEAKRYLKNYALDAGDYDHLYNEKWAATSEPLKLGEGYFCNQITYHIDGNEHAVTCLTLVLDVNETELLEDAMSKFKEISEHLFEKSVCDNKKLNITLEKVDGENDEIYQTQTTEIEGRHLMMQKWNHINRDTFELRLSFAIAPQFFRYADTI